MKIAAWVSVGMVFVTLVYFGFSGVTTAAFEGDSLAYHIPISQMVGLGKWMKIEEFEKPFYFYPAMGETFLSGLRSLGVPDNLFNVVGWVLLGVGGYGLWRRMNFTKETTLVAVGGILMWPSVIRLLNNQTVDIYLAVWWVWAVFWWEKGRLTISQWVLLGIVMGMLCGTKVSGMLFAGVLLCVYLKKWINTERRNLIGFLVTFLVVGGFWYMRNWILTGNPVYPATIVGWQGDPNFHLMDWTPWKTLSQTPGGVGRLAEGLGSEFLVWPISLALTLITRSRWILLGWLNFLVYLVLPSWPVNLISDLRYTYVAFIPLMVGIWGYAKEKGKQELLTVLTLMCMAVEFSQLDFRPKIFMVGMMGVLIGWGAIHLYEMRSK